MSEKIGPLVLTHSQAKGKTWAIFRRRIRRSWQLYLLLALPLAWLIVFQYYPMYGAQIAFRNFLPGDSMWKAEWVGLENFHRFFESPMFSSLMTNTLGLSLYSLAVGFPIPIILALSLNQLRDGLFKKTVQLVSYAPYFISTVVMVGMLLQFLDLRHGPINILLQALGKTPKHFMGEANLFPSIYVWSGVWQYMGFNTVIYLAALSTIDPALHEAAVVDGATRLQRIWHIDLPGIMPTAVTLLILNMGQIINVGFEKVYLMQNPLNTATSEVISTYVYKIGLIGGITNYSYASAIGLFNSVVGLVLLIVANYLMKKLTEYSLW
ncbi:MAG: ABC transporter permease subunit [Chloroflexi bacterium]|nr:ABC transporter permease subunit [Chloroflexota bacterium]